MYSQLQKGPHNSRVRSRVTKHRMPTQDIKELTRQVSIHWHQAIQWGWILYILQRGCSTPDSGRGADFNQSLEGPGYWVMRGHAGNDNFQAPEVCY